MKLYFKKECLGVIKNINISGIWANGTLEPNININKFKYMFQELVNEDKEFDESQYDPEYLDDNNWFIQNDHGDVKGISLPAIYNNGDINWRWR